MSLADCLLTCKGELHIWSGSGSTSILVSLVFLSYRSLLGYDVWLAKNKPGILLSWAVTFACWTAFWICSFCSSWMKLPWRYWLIFGRILAAELYGFTLAGGFESLSPKISSASSRSSSWDNEFWAGVFDWDQFAIWLSTPSEHSIAVPWIVRRVSETVR
jgi:hypothetical protein